MGLFGCLARGKLINIQAEFITADFSPPLSVMLDLSVFICYMSLENFRQHGVRVAKWEEVSVIIMKPVKWGPSSWKHKLEDSSLTVNILHSFC